MAVRLGPLRRGLALVVVLVAAALLVYQLLLRDTAIGPRLVASQPVAAIGSGEDAVAVAADGRVLAWLPPPAADSLPLLPLAEPPPSGRLRGPALEQARALAAAPDEVRPYVAGSHYGEGGVTVDLSTGIELRFGDATQAARKWRAAMAVLASPSVTAVDSVDVQAPSHPSIRGSGHELPPLP